jgi:predicted DNA-binding transcriptional regulator
MNNEIIEDNRLELLFRHAGMGEKEAKLYRLLLVTGEIKASTLAKKSGIKRTNVYALLQVMKARGLVMEFEKGKIKYYRPEPPNKITEIIESQSKRLTVAQELSKDIIPMLTSQWKTSINRPVVRYFEGKDGIEKLFQDIYGPKTGDNTVWGCVDLDITDIEFPKHVEKKLIPIRKRNKWLAKTIFADSPYMRELQKKDNEQLRESVLVDKKKYPLPAEIDVYEDKVTLLSFERGEFVAVMIENKHFAETIRSLFKLAMENPSAHRTAQPQASLVQNSTLPAFSSSSQNTDKGN